jgi:transketolase
MAADLTRIAAEIRGQLVEMSHKAHAAHLGSALSCVDILVSLYFGGVLRIDPAKPDDPDRDIFILSKGHAIAAQYVCLARRGFFPVAELETYGKPGSRLPEQPGPRCVPGIEAATGSLGHGLSIGVGMALAAKIQGRPTRVFVVVGDGECNEGAVWEAAMFAAAKRLDNLTVVVDANGLQGIGSDTEIMNMRPHSAKWCEFGWDTVPLDGHNITGLLFDLTARPNNGSPKAIVAHTIKGKGVSFMSGNNNWHYRIPTADEVAAAKKELGV